MLCGTLTLSDRGGHIVSSAQVSTDVHRRTMCLVSLLLVPQFDCMAEGTSLLSAVLVHVGLVTFDTSQTRRSGATSGTLSSSQTLKLIRPVL